MVRHNNVIPNGHFHKKWQQRVRVLFNQPFKKNARKLKRDRKTLKISPRTIKLLRPIVRCPTVRYHTKIRAGRGFSLTELKAAGLNKNYAKSIGIAVEHRRRNKSLEGMVLNVQRLKEYIRRLVLYPKNKKKAAEIVQVKPNEAPYVVLNKKESLRKARLVTEEMKNFEAYVTLRKARASTRKKRRKHTKKRCDNFDGPDLKK